MNPDAVGEMLATAILPFIPPIAAGVGLLVVLALLFYVFRQIMR